MKSHLLIVAGIAVAAIAPGAMAQPAAPAAAPAAAAKPTAPLFIAIPELAGKGKLTVTSTAFKNGGSVPMANSGWGGNASPPLSWNAVPGAKSYAVIMEDASAARMGEHIFHWPIYNLTVTSLPAGIPATATTQHPVAMQGKNISGGDGYRGPKPPAGSKPHAYHLQVFALDTKLPLQGGADRGQILAAMKGHVLASGEIVGNASPPANAAATPPAAK
jgi:Raf kinase inhibitor-like YbhB/YbcL family protein